MGAEHERSRGRAHDRYDELAVGHVFGGLDPVDAADFRSHLVACRDCRLHVAELRELISDLAAAEREERAAARLQTEVAPPEAPPRATPRRSWRASTRAALAMGLVVLAGMVGLAFWNLHLRDNVEQLTAANRRAANALTMLASGVPVVVELSPGISGLVVADDEAFAVTLTGVPRVRTGELVAVWLVADGSTRLFDRAARLPGGRLALSGQRGGAETLVITVQDHVVPLNAPDGDVLARAELDRPRATLAPAS